MNYTVRDLDSLIEILETVEPDDIIDVVDDITIDSTITITRSTSINLHSHVFILDTLGRIVVTSKAIVAMCNGFINCYSNNSITVHGDDSKICLNDRLCIKSHSTPLHAYNGGSIAVTGATVYSNGFTPTAYITGIKSSISVIYGVISCDGDTAISIRDGGVGFVGGYGTVISTSIPHTPSRRRPTIYVADNGSVLIVTGNGKVVSQHSFVISIAGGASCSIESGTIQGYSNKDSIISIEDSGSALRIIGGKLVSNSDGIIFYHKVPGELNTLDVVGGEFLMNNGKIIASIPCDFMSAHSVHLFGGIFIGELDPIYLPPGKHIDENGHLVDDDPEPPPGPDPDPGPEPGPSPDPEPDPYEFSLSGKIWVYLTPSLQKPVYEVVNALTVYKKSYIDPETGEEFKKVRVKIKAEIYFTGFVLAKDLK